MALQVTNERVHWHQYGKFQSSGAASFWIILATCSSAATVQWNVADGGNDHFYEAVSVPAGITWTAAYNAAELAGGYLATLTSSEENAFVFSLIGDDSLWYVNADNFYHGPWLGGFQPAGSPEPAGNWQWVTGEPFGYTNWNPDSGEPNDHHGEDKLHYHSQGSKAATWNDLKDDVTSLGFYIPGYVVEYNTLVPEPSSVLLLTIATATCLIPRRRQR